MHGRVTCHLNATLWCTVFSVSKLEFTSALLQSLAWPLVVLILALVFIKQLKSLFDAVAKRADSLVKMSALGGSAEFASPAEKTVEKIFSDESATLEFRERVASIYREEAERVNKNTIQPLNQSLGYRRDLSRRADNVIANAGIKYEHQVLEVLELLSPKEYLVNTEQQLGDVRHDAIISNISEGKTDLTRALAVEIKLRLSVEQLRNYLNYAIDSSQVLSRHLFIYAEMSRDGDQRIVEYLVKYQQHTNLIIDVIHYDPDAPDSRQSLISRIQQLLS